MNDVDYLLTDEFVEFSNKIGDIHKRKKAKKEELNKFMAKIKGEIEDLNKEAEKAKEEFESWRRETTGVSISGDKQEVKATTKNNGGCDHIFSVKKDFDVQNVLQLLKLCWPNGVIEDASLETDSDDLEQYFVFKDMKTKKLLDKNFCPTNNFIHVLYQPDELALVTNSEDDPIIKLVGHYLEVLNVT